MAPPACRRWALSQRVMDAAPNGAVVGILLTGGAGRRIGTDKARLVYRGETLAGRLGSRLAGVTWAAVEVGPARSGLPSVMEDPPGRGPLAGIAAGWERLRSLEPRAAVVLACDLPRLEQPMLALLAGYDTESSVVPLVGGRLQLLCARWSAAALERAGALASQGKLAVAELLAAAPVHFLAQDAWGHVATEDAFADVDTPEDLRRLGVVVDPTLPASSSVPSSPGAPERSGRPGAADAAARRRSGWARPPASATSLVRVEVLRAPGVDATVSAPPGGARPAAASARAARGDHVVTEAALEIRLGTARTPARPVATVLRTPGDDLHLAVGFLLSEGYLRDASLVRSVGHCDGPEGPESDVVSVRVTGDLPEVPERPTLVTAACGLCGRRTLEGLEHPHVHPPPGARLELETLLGLPERLRSQQRLFASTGGSHGAGLFDLSGALRAHAEDVGRHNAVDKLVGRAALEGWLPATQGVLVLSGRAGYELVHKAALAGIPWVVAVSAPSSLAVSRAEESGMTLVGFARDRRVNVYSRPGGIAMPGPGAPG